MSHAPILIIAGTNRPGSNALRIARALQVHYHEADIPHQLYSLADLPPEAFLPSVYATKPASVVEVQQRVLDAGGLHIVTPEYNGGFPGVLKYFVDLLKFPESFNRKPVALVGEAAGVWGGLRAVEQLQMIFAYRNAHVLPERVFIPHVNQKFDPAGKLIDADIDQRLARQAKEFSVFVTALGRV